MGRHSVDGGSEACSLLLDLCSLYLDGKDKRGVGAKMPAQFEAMHNELLTSRAVVLLVGFLDSFTKGPSSDDEMVTMASQSSQTLERLVFTFSTACLQSPDILTSFILRLPTFVPSIHKIAAGGTWRPLWSQRHLRWLHCLY